MEVVAKPKNLDRARARKKQEDYLLVQRAVNGDQKAYASLLNRYRAPVYHAIYKMVNNRDDADDLTLEAFGKAFHKLSSYTPKYAFSTWLFKIAINNCIDHIRKKRLYFLSIDEPIEAGAEDDFASNLKASIRNPEEEIIRDQQIKLLRHLITKLNTKYRLMIEMRFFEDLSYDEISRELNIPLGTVKAQLFRAKEILYKQLQQPGAKMYFDTVKRRSKPAKKVVNQPVAAVA